MLRGKKKVFIFCNGCSRRSLDTSRLTDYFTVNNFNITTYPERADYIIFVTCALIYKEEQSFELIEKFSGCKGELIVMGCLPDMSHTPLREKFKGRFIETRNLNTIDAIFPNFKVKFSSISDGHILGDYFLNFNMKRNTFLRFFSHFALRKEFFSKCVRFFRKKLKKVQEINKETQEAYLRISNGCLERCAYCSIWKAVGEFRSKGIEECVSEYKELLQKGHRFIVFIADNLGPYGLDIGTDFRSLIEKLSVVDNGLHVRWRFEEMHPRWVIKYKDTLSRLIIEGKLTEMICGIQSGSNRMLKLMNRHHAIEEIIEALASFKKINPAFKLYTQVIVGFPSETEDDLFETIEALKKLRFESVYIFPYCDGVGSSASTMSDKISESIITERVNKAKVLLEKAGITIKFY
ncbi:MAG: radical SAM protein [Candidatus Omnitrophota bacterium]